MEKVNLYCSCATKVYNGKANGKHYIRCPNCRRRTSNHSTIAQAISEFLNFESREFIAFYVSTNYKNFGSINQIDGIEEKYKNSKDYRKGYVRCLHECGLLDIISYNIMLGDIDNEIFW